MILAFILIFLVGVALYLDKRNLGFLLFRLKNSKMSNDTIINFCEYHLKTVRNPVRFLILKLIIYKTKRR